jgi:ribosomal-protein-alanine N-acetyltransferase
VRLSLRFRIETERLILRAPRAVDVPELRALMRRNAKHLAPWQPAPLPGIDPTSLAEVSKSVTRWRREWTADRGYTFLVTLRVDDEPVIGRMSLTHVARGAWQNAHLGYWIDENQQGKGIASEAALAVARFAFETLALHRVQAAVMPKNDASLRVLEKAGFRREGTSPRFLQIAGAWEDHVIFARTSD